MRRDVSRRLSSSESQREGGYVKRKRNKKLELNRESLRMLQEDALTAARGAVTTRFPASLCTPCYTTETVDPCCTS